MKNVVSTVAMKLGMVMCMVVGGAMAVGCAAPSADDGGVSEQDENTNQEMPTVEDGITAPRDVTYVSLNCGKTFPGMPPLPCKPDLKFTQTVTQIWEPNNAQNYAPGYYINFGFTNDSEKDTGPFRAHIKDGNGNILKTVDVPNLAPHQGWGIQNAAPYECGWSRTAVLDVNGVVAEADETNNTNSYQKRCPIVRPPGSILP